MRTRKNTKRDWTRIGNSNSPTFLNIIGSSVGFCLEAYDSRKHDPSDISIEAASGIVLLSAANLITNTNEIQKLSSKVPTLLHIHQQSSNFDLSLVGHKLATAVHTTFLTHDSNHFCTWIFRSILSLIGNRQSGNLLTSFLKWGFQSQSCSALTWQSSMQKMGFANHPSASWIGTLLHCQLPLAPIAVDFRSDGLYLQTTVHSRFTKSFPEIASSLVHELQHQLSGCMVVQQLSDCDLEIMNLVPLSPIDNADQRLQAVVIVYRRPQATHKSTKDEREAS